MLNNMLVMSVFVVAAIAMVLVQSYRPRRALRASAQLVGGIGWFVTSIALVRLDVSLLMLGGLSVAGAWSIGRSV
jgi:hypothetical protein